MNRRTSIALAPLVLLAACADRVPTAPADAALKKDPAPSAGAGPTVVMTGLNNPRGLAFGPEGALYVAEAGTQAINGPCAPAARSGRDCYSGTGSISRLWKGQQERVLTGLPSVVNYAPPPGGGPEAPGDVAGPHHVSFQGRGNGYVTIGWGGPPNARAGLGPLGTQLGHLVRFQPSGRWELDADISAFEQAADPDNEGRDSNPYGLLAEPGRQYVTDAGGNSLLEVQANGAISLVAVFPRVAVPPGPANPPFTSSQAVPTEVRRGPDGALYVSTLTGAPFRAGLAGIYRVVPGGAPQLAVGGFKAITDFDVTRDGTLYVVQYSAGPVFFAPNSGSVVRVAPDGTRTTIAAGLNFPTGVAVGPDGAVYVINNGIAVGGGTVVRIAP